MAVGTTKTARDAVPARERDALARLNAALKPDASSVRVGPDGRILLAFFPVLLLPFVAAGLFALHVPASPADLADWRQWLDPGAFALTVLVAVVGFLWLMLRIADRFQASRPDSAEHAIFEFYRAAQHNPARLGGLACLHDRPETPRPVFHWLTAAAAPPIDSAKAVTRYWNMLLRGNPEVVRKVKLRALAVTTPRGDVALARCALRVRSIRRIRARAALIPAFALAVTPFAIGYQRIADAGFHFWPVALGALLLAPGVWWLVRKLGHAVVETRDVVLQKLLVRSGYNWRLLYAEWEADAETDLGWLK